MLKTNKKRLGAGRLVAVILTALIGYGVLIHYLARGKNVAVFSPKGLIAHQQFSLLVFTVTVLLLVAIPTLTLLFYTAWKYRETSHASHVHAQHTGKYLNWGIWLIPTTVMLILAFVMWPATHRLVPQKLIAAEVKPLRIQVIALRWKWLFIYPDQKIATVNFVQIPENTPVQFELTADEAPMSSFWIPNLGGQLYAMTSHVNRLNLMGDTLGDFPGSSAEINGAGFAGMKFTTRVSRADEFENWVRGVKWSPDELDAAVYKKLLQPSENNQPTYFSTYDSTIYDSVISKYLGPSGGHRHHE
ncbi:MAG: ubiquinol oxidase subunit II [Candidatus Saccharimonadales bacterium]